jgi:hypothetical protein
VGAGRLGAPLSPAKAFCPGRIAPRPKLPHRTHRAVAQNLGRVVLVVDDEGSPEVALIAFRATLDTLERRLHLLFRVGGPRATLSMPRLPSLRRNAIAISCGDARPKNTPFDRYGPGRRRYSPERSAAYGRNGGPGQGQPPPRSSSRTNRGQGNAAPCPGRPPLLPERSASWPRFLHLVRWVNRSSSSRKEDDHVHPGTRDYPRAADARGADAGRTRDDAG